MGLLNLLNRLNDAHWAHEYLRGASLEQLETVLRLARRHESDRLRVMWEWAAQRGLRSDSLRAAAAVREIMERA